VIKFHCKNCGEKFSVPEIHAGKKGKCPKCKNIIFVPQIQDTSPITTQSKTADQKSTPKDSPHSLTFLDFPNRQDALRQKDKPQGQSTIQEHKEELERATKADQPKPMPKRKLPWIIDIFLYPLNLAGIIHLICLWLLVFLLCPLVIKFLSLGIEYIPIVYILPVAYTLYYFAECIRDSATGGCRAPDFWMHPGKSDKWDYISQFMIVLGCIAVCFWPVSVYYIVTERTDLIYWLLLACGGFFFPMVLLAAVLFDSFNALNPILIIGSIFRTFLPYCGMALLFYSGALLFMKIDSQLHRLRLLPALPLIIRAAQLYLAFVAVGLLGRFHWRYQDKLRWDV
jgi:DNA-directed RNA polymerase subunit RPC12/RpoP